MIREIQRELPHHVKTWIDERELLLGDNLQNSIRSAITNESDFVVIFIGPEAVRSEWVKKELEWALEHERTINRIFVLPVLLDKESWRQLPAEFQERRYLPCADFSESAIKDFSGRLANELFALVAAVPIRSVSQSFILEQEDMIKRRELVRKIASRITDELDQPTDKTRLTRERLELIVSSLEPIRKVELLCLFELQFGKFKDLLLETDIVKAHLLRIEIIVGYGDNLRKWTHMLDWASKPFRSLQEDYGLGDNRYEVRDVFLKAIDKLSESEKKELFSSIEIIRCSFDR